MVNQSISFLLANHEKRAQMVLFLNGIDWLVKSNTIHPRFHDYLEPSSPAVFLSHAPIFSLLAVLHGDLSNDIDLPIPCSKLSLWNLIDLLPAVLETFFPKYFKRSALSCSTSWHIPSLIPLFANLL